jgi:hypothetical protein
MLVMPLDEVLNANIILKPSAELEISPAKVAERCYQCHDIMAAGLVIWQLPLCLCYECSVFLIRRRAYARQDVIWQHLLACPRGIDTQRSAPDVGVERSRKPPAGPPHTAWRWIGATIDEWSTPSS